MFTDFDITVLKQYLEIMEPFIVFGNKLGGEDRSTVHLVYPMVQELLCHLEDKIKNNVQKIFCQMLETEVKKYFQFVLNSDASDFNPFFIVATLLDPFYKGSLEENMLNTARNELKRFIKEETQNEESQSDNLSGEDPIVILSMFNVIFIRWK